MAPTHADARLDALVHLLYDAVFEAQLWTGIAPKIARAFDSSSTVLKTHGAGDRVELVEVTENLIVAPKDEAWANYWHRNDLWVERTVALGLGRIVTGEDLLSHREFEGSGFYQDWIRHLDIYHVVGAAFHVDENTVGVLGIHRTKGAGTYVAEDRRRVARFLPHLNRALAMRDKLMQASLTQRASLDALERLSTSVIVLDGDCRVLHTNSRADRALSAITTLRVRGGRLMLTDPQLGARFAEDVRNAASTAAGKPRVPARALALNRPGRLPVTMLIAPLPAGSLSAAPHAPAVMIFVRDPEDPTPEQSTLRELFDLTPAEAAITAALVAGKSLPEIATTLRIGVGTVRWHLKMILSKTGTHRQAQLVALVAHSVATMSSSKPPEAH